MKPYGTVGDGYLTACSSNAVATMGAWVPFKQAQYAALQCMIGQVTGLKPGKTLHMLSTMPTHL